MKKRVIFFICCLNYLVGFSQEKEVNIFDYVETHIYDIGEVNTSPNSISLLQSCADEEDANCLNLLGVLYSQGLGVERDQERAFKLIANSAKKAFPPAEYNLGNFYKRGIGCPQDFDKAIYWFSVAADHGNERAAYMLGYMHFKGFGVAQNYKKAIEWFELSSWPMAYNFLGICYYFGYGVEKNEDKAILYFTKSKTTNSDMYLKHIAENIKEGVDYSIDKALKENETKLNSVISKETINQTVVESSKTFEQEKTIDGKSLNGKWKGKLIEFDWSGKKITRIIPISSEFRTDKNEISYKLEINKVKIENNGFYQDNTLLFKNDEMNFDWSFSDDPNSNIIEWQLLSSEMKFKVMGNIKYLVGNLQTFSDKWKESGPPMYLIMKPIGSLDEELTNDQLISVNNKENFIVLYPNPFQNDFFIEYELEKEAKVSVEIYNYNGNNITLEHNSLQNLGKHKYLLNGAKLQAGIYIVRVKVDNEIHSRIILKN